MEGSSSSLKRSSSQLDHHHKFDDGDDDFLPSCPPLKRQRLDLQKKQEEPEEKPITENQPRIVHPLVLETYNRYIDRLQEKGELVAYEDSEDSSEMKYTKKTWQHITTRLASYVRNSNEAITADSCFIGDMKPTKHGYLQLRVRDTMKSVHQLAGKLSSGRVGNSTDNTSHLCGNALCMNPSHFVIEPAKTNHSRKYCMHGARQMCPHEPSCFFTDHATGLPLPCRNKERVKKCKCKQQCFAPRTLQCATTKKANQK